MVTGSRPLASPQSVRLAHPLSSLTNAPHHRCRCSPEAPRRRRARSARPRPFQPLRPPPLDARRRAASNAPSHNPADPLCAKPAPLPSRAAAFGSSESTPARLRPVADVAPRGLPCEADVWALGALLTGLTQSTGPTGPLAVALGGGAQASHVGGQHRSNSNEPNAAARLGRGAGFTHRGSAGSWRGAFDAARRRASNGGGRRGWNGRGRALRARRRRGASGWGGCGVRARERPN